MLVAHDFEGALQEGKIDMAGAIFMVARVNGRLQLCPFLGRHVACDAFEDDGQSV